MFNTPKFKKIDAIEYKGYEIPIYSNGETKYAGHPVDQGELPEENKIYSIDDISKIKSALYHIVNHGDGEDRFPSPIGKVRIKKPKIGISESKTIVITESQFRELVKTLK